MKLPYIHPTHNTDLYIDDRVSVQTYIVVQNDGGLNSRLNPV